MEDWQQRVLDEHIALKDKLDKLQKFLAAPPTWIKDVDLKLLTAQFAAMTAYEQLLVVRISRFT